MSAKPAKTNEYADWLGELKTRIQAGRTTAARAVNRELILLYWDIGRGIVEKQAELGWGKSVVERLSKDLKAEFPGLKGFSTKNLWLMRQFYQEYTSAEFLEQAVQEFKHGENLQQAVGDLASPDEILQQPVAELKKAVVTPVSERLSQAVRELAAVVPWGHHANHLVAIPDPAKRLYYLLATARFGWTRKVLLNQIKATPTGAAGRRANRTTFPSHCRSSWPSRRRRFSRVLTTSNFSASTGR